MEGGASIVVVRHISGVDQASERPSSPAAQHKHESYWATRLCEKRPRSDRRRRSGATPCSPATGEGVITSSLQLRSEQCFQKLRIFCMLM
jgi:hypothetical protein